MGRALVFEGPRRIGVVDEPDPTLGPGKVRVRTLFSGISTGTELTAYRGTNPYLHKRWDPERRLFMSDERSAPAYPLIGWGYEEVGEVVEAADDVASLRIGQCVAGRWGHRTTAVVDGADAMALPDGIEPVLGVFARMVEIGLTGIWDARIGLGETVAVFGLGVLGQIAAQLARISGARIVAVDPLETRRDLVRRLGADQVLDADDAAITIKDLTEGRGADACVESSGTDAGLREAIRACAYNGRVVALGFYQGESQLALGEEFHHNRIQLIGSQVSGLSAELAGRWDVARRARAAIELIATGRLELRPLISHLTSFEEAAALFETLDERPAEAMQAVLTFGADPPAAPA